MSHKDRTLRPRSNIGPYPDPSKANISVIAGRHRPGYHFYLPTPNNKENVSQKKTSKIKRNLINQLTKYCENTTLHGLRYVGDAQLTYGERIFWLVSFSLAIGVASYYISNIYTKWNSSPVFIGLSPFDTDLGSIPFPAVTICNMNQAKRSEAERILKQGSVIERKLLQDTCDGNSTFNTTEKIGWTNLRNFLIRVGSSCSDMLRSCLWGSERVNCSDIFNNELTDEGLCCSFNRLPPEKIFRNSKPISLLNQTYPDNIFDWDAEKGYEGAPNDDFIPRKPLGAGITMGLTVFLDAKVEDYYCSSTSSTGFKVKVHDVSAIGETTPFKIWPFHGRYLIMVMLSDPIQSPQMADFGVLMPPGFETRMAIEPAVLEATDALIKIPTEKRQCYFSHEHQLTFYRKYSSKNCRFECQSVKLLEECGCVPYFLPRADKVNVCLRKNVCAQKVLGLTAQSHHTERTLKENMSCNCLPRCFKIDYNYFMTSAPLNIMRKSKFSEEFIRENFARIIVFFDSTSYSRIHKMPIYNFTDLMAYTGGLLGLFIGFSFLSVIEIFFHIIWTTWKKYVMTSLYKKKIITQEELPPPFPFVN